ncbi:MAG: squalene--hopene cyclase [Pirellulales bacterium]|nr:squalene--hopene cyclase [Pirellulales bacterium]
MIDPARLRDAWNRARRDLLAQRDADGHWIGELAASALATATATSALALVARHAPAGADDAPLLRRGLEWLLRHVNPDGGWGDTDRSLSNIATTMLVRAAFTLCGAAEARADLMARADRYIQAQGGIPGLRRRYGADKTFAVPILAHAALAGRVPWREVDPLPFELACFPRSMFRFLRLPVVSYAVPALVAIGQARFFHSPPANPIARLARRMALERSLRVVESMQPASGGFLEAVPLTSFVVMSLAGTGRADHAIAQRGAAFLRQSARADGGWPIDTNLATWNTTLAVNALARGDCPDFRSTEMGLSPSSLDAAPSPLPWLLSCQHRRRHPFTGAAPGGWGWTDLDGAVPDADDTAGALLAIDALRGTMSTLAVDMQTEVNEHVHGKRGHGAQASAVRSGVRWLLDVQNADGGWPTFCRGWGKLPFDRSGTDLTAHALRALGAHRRAAPAAIDRAVAQGFAFLARTQRHDGAWTPLWFGNQHDPAKENPIYGTARVLAAYRAFGRLDAAPARRGLAWLSAHAGADCGWGGNLNDRSGVEETALAVEALLGAPDDPLLQVAIQKGLAWLVAAVESGRHREAAPIGLYFARLWYYERTYPLALTVSALGRAVEVFCPTDASTP